MMTIFSMNDHHKNLLTIYIGFFWVPVVHEELINLYMLSSFLFLSNMLLATHGVGLGNMIMFLCVF
jgi:hypothetical protein